MGRTSNDGEVDGTGNGNGIRSYALAANAARSGPNPGAPATYCQYRDDASSPVSVYRHVW
jgi:hypothetical protein